MKSSFVWAMDRLYLFSIWSAGVAIILMSLIIPWGVFTRYVLGQGSQWPEPIAILLMMVFTFIGAAAAYRANGHIAVGLLTDALPAPAKALCAGVVHALMLCICGFVAVYGFSLVAGTMGQTISELSWLPVGVTYLSLPVGAVLTALFVVEHAWCGSQAHRRLMRYEEALDGETLQVNEGAR